MNYDLTRKLLFQLSPELAHTVTMRSLNRLGRMGLSSLLAPEFVDDPVEVMGLRFPNPVGLAAGLDKDGICIDGLGGLGFGFLEVGTVTPRPQSGNPKPRLFRLPEHEALINRLGFNNAGVDVLLRRLEQISYSGLLGINIGKNRDTPVNAALGDYRYCMERVYDHASYITVNISSPNTPGLRDLQHRDALNQLLEGLKTVHERLGGSRVPLVVKIAPDMSDDEAVGVISQLIDFEVDGVIVSNTTVSRKGVSGRHVQEEGGLSGAPLRERALQVLRVVADEAGERLAVIGTGGITRGQHAAEKVAEGANLVQIYTGFIYRGPDLIADSVRAIKDLTRG
ncbi:MAG: quinone-dependent dihydroorotate dehydrogenase [Pseudomonadota bacterium]